MENECTCGAVTTPHEIGCPVAKGNPCHHCGRMNDEHWGFCPEKLNDANRSGVSVKGMTPDERVAYINKFGPNVVAIEELQERVHELGELLGWAYLRLTAFGSGSMETALQLDRIKLALLGSQSDAKGDA